MRNQNGKALWTGAGRLREKSISDAAIQSQLRTYVRGTSMRSPTRTNPISMAVANIAADEIARNGKSAMISCNHDGQWILDTFRGREANVPEILTLIEKMKPDHDGVAIDVAANALMLRLGETMDANGIITHGRSRVTILPDPIKAASEEGMACVSVNHGTGKISVNPDDGILKIPTSWIGTQVRVPHGFSAVPAGTWSCGKRKITVEILPSGTESEDILTIRPEQARHYAFPETDIYTHHETKIRCSFVPAPEKTEIQIFAPHSATAMAKTAKLADNDHQIRMIIAPMAALTYQNGTDPTGTPGMTLNFVEKLAGPEINAGIRIGSLMIPVRTNGKTRFALPETVLDENSLSAMALADLLENAAAKADIMDGPMAKRLAKTLRKHRDECELTVEPGDREIWNSAQWIGFGSATPESDMIIPLEHMDTVRMIATGQPFSNRHMKALNHQGYLKTPQISTPVRFFSESSNEDLRRLGIISSDRSATLAIARMVAKIP